MGCVGKPSVLLLLRLVGQGDSGGSFHSLADGLQWVVDVMGPSMVPPSLASNSPTAVASAVSRGNEEVIVELLRYLRDMVEVNTAMKSSHMQPATVEPVAAAPAASTSATTAVAPNTRAGQALRDAGLATATTAELLARAAREYYDRRAAQQHSEEEHTQGGAAQAQAAAAPSKQTIASKHKRGRGGKGKRSTARRGAKRKGTAKARSPKAQPPPPPPAPSGAWNSSTAVMHETRTRSTVHARQERLIAAGSRTATSAGDVPSSQAGQDGAESVFTVVSVCCAWREQA